MGLWRKGTDDPRLQDAEFLSLFQSIERVWELRRQKMAMLRELEMELVEAVEEVKLPPPPPPPPPPSPYAARPMVNPSSPIILPSLNLSEARKLLILRALDEAEWNQSRAAKKLGISSRTLNYHMQQLNIPRPMDLKKETDDENQRDA